MDLHIVGDLIVAGMSFWVGWFANQWWTGRQPVRVDPNIPELAELAVVPVGDPQPAPIDPPEPKQEPVNPNPAHNWCLLYGADGTLHSVRTMAGEPPPYFERHHGKGSLHRYVLFSKDDDRFVYRLKP